MSDPMPGAEKPLAVGDAFEALATIARRQFESGRSNRSAGIKPALQASTDPPFNETDLGYSTFREFVVAAEKEGYVSIVQADSGPDVLILPPEAPRASTSERAPRRGKTGEKIRPDLWRAFTRWAENDVRVWDSGRQMAFVFPKEPSSSDPEDVSAVRSAMQSDPGRFESIEPVSPEVLQVWMREFTDDQPDAVATAALKAALEGELPIRRFTQTVRELGLGRPWHLTHLRHVASEIGRWADEHSVHIDSIYDTDVARAPSHTVSAGRAQVSPASLDQIRDRVYRFVAQMTEPELLQIPIPLRLLMVEHDRP